jgi:O-antigen/teichoic acid export membrane protein
MLANLQGIRIALGAAGVALAVLFGLLAGYDGTMLAGIALTGASVVITAFQAALGIPLSTGLRWGAVTALDLVRQAAQVGLFLLLVAVGAGLLPFFAVAIPASLIVLGLTVRLVRGAAPIRPAFDWARWRELLRLVAPFAAATAVGTLYVYEAAVLMELVSTPQEVGWFAASFRIFTVLSGIPLLLVGAIFPILARASRDDRARHAYAASRLLEAALIGGAWLSLMTALLAPVAIDVVAGPSFGQSVDVLRIQAIAVLSSCVLVAATHVLISLALYRDVLLLSAAALVISGALVLALGGPMGAEGGALANVGGETVGALAGVVFVSRAAHGLGLRWTSPAKVLVGLAPGGALALLTNVPDAAVAVIATVAYALVLWVSGAIPREIVDAVPRPGRPRGPR